MKLLYILLAVLFLCGCVSDEAQIKDIISQVLQDEYIMSVEDDAIVDVDPELPDNHDPVIVEPVADVEPITEIAVPYDINWVSFDLSGWAETTDLAVTISGDKIILDYDRPSSWKPVLYQGGYVCANLWMVFKHNGEWTASSIEWLRVGQTVKQIKCISGDHMTSRELKDWKPTKGETLWFFVAGLSRGNIRNVSERTNIIERVW